MTFVLAKGSSIVVFSNSLSAPPQEQKVMARACARASPGKPAAPAAAPSARMCRRFSIMVLPLCCVGQDRHGVPIPADLHLIPHGRLRAEDARPELDAAGEGHAHRHELA